MQYRRSQPAGHGLDAQGGEALADAAAGAAIEEFKRGADREQCGEDQDAAADRGPAFLVGEIAQHHRAVLGQRHQLATGLGQLILQQFVALVQPAEQARKRQCFVGRRRGRLRRRRPLLERGDQEIARLPIGERRGEAVDRAGVEAFGQCRRRRRSLGSAGGDLRRQRRGRRCCGHDRCEQDGCDQRHRQPVKHPAPHQPALSSKGVRSRA